MSGSELGPWPPSVTGFFRKSFQVFTARGVPGDAGRDVVGDAAEPGELGAVEGRAAFQQRIDAGGAREGAEGACRPWAPRSRCSSPRLQRAGARHVLRHDGRIAGDVLADVAGEMPRVEVVAAADREADHEVDGLALVELLDASGRGGQGGERTKARAAGRQRRMRNSRRISFRPRSYSQAAGIVDQSPLAGHATERHAAVATSRSRAQPRYSSSWRVLSCRRHVKKLAGGA